MTLHSLSRRTMLRGLGTAIALPFLDVMRPTRLLAATSAATAPPLRMGFFYVPNGMHMADWTPKVPGDALELAPTMQALRPHQNALTVLSGLALDGAAAHGDGPGDHARSGAAFLTAAHPRKTKGADIFNGVSIDQVVAAKMGHETRFASLELGLQSSSQAGNCDSGYSCAYSSNLSWRGPTHPVAKENDPRSVFDRLFAGQNVKETSRAKSEREKHRSSVLDYAMEDAKRLNDILPATDRRKLDEYLYSIREIERRVNGAETLDLAAAGVEDYTRPSGVPRDLSLHSRLMMDMVRLAFQTDSTRIMTFMFANELNNRPYNHIGVNDGHHELSHHGKSKHKQSEIAKIDRYHVEQFAYLLSQLAAVPEGDATLIDHCMIVYGSGISDGDRHDHDNLPILLAGGAGGRLKTGRHLRYRRSTPLANLYLWMMNQMGVQSDQFGDSSGPLAKL